MNLPFPLEPYRQGIADVVTSVFKTMLDVSVKPLKAPGKTPAGGFTGAVYYGGAWRGALMVECGREQLEDWAARFLSASSPVPLEDAMDGLGEVTNVIAGNLKPLLPAGVGISPPSVIQGGDYRLRICGGNLNETLCFEDGIGWFRITLLEVLPT